MVIKGGVSITVFYTLYDCNINFSYRDLVPGSAEDEWLDSQNLNSPFKPLFDEVRQKVKNITLEQVKNILESIGYTKIEIRKDSFVTQSGRVHMGQTGPYDSCRVYFEYKNYSNNERINKDRLKRRLIRLINW